jgi:hypothetical protein
MTSVIILWKKEDKSDIMIAKGSNGKPLLFEFKSVAMRYANENYGFDYGFGSGRPTTDFYNYNVVEL